MENCNKCPELNARVAELEQMCESLQAQNEKSEAALNDATAQLDEANTAAATAIAHLQARDQKIAELELQLAAAEGVVLKIAPKPAQGVPKIPKEIIPVQGKHCKFTLAQFRYADKIMTAEEAMHDKSIHADLLKLGVLKQTH